MALFLIFIKMKAFISLIIILSTMSCVSQKSNSTQESIKEIVFNAQTRGSLVNITVSDYTVFYKTHGNSKTYAINASQRKELEALINKLNIKNISELKAPSNKRAFDGALRATLAIKIGETNYVSSEFDDDNPPEEIKAIIDTLRSYIQ